MGTDGGPRTMSCMEQLYSYFSERYGRAKAARQRRVASGAER